MGADALRKRDEEMKDFSTLFARPMPVMDCKPCNEAWAIKATVDMNARLEVIQREFSVKSEMSQFKAAGFHFSC